MAESGGKGSSGGNGPGSGRIPQLAPVAAAAIALSAVVAYRNSFAGAFLYDDDGSIVNNPSIRSLRTALFPPAGGLPVAGRPVANLSLALNYAISGLQVWSYHALSLLIHIGAGLVLFGVVRRTLRLPAPRASRAAMMPAAGPLGSVVIAFLVALLWTLHPLQTEAVTYLSQRAEELMGLFYLLTMYGFIRSAGPAGARSGLWSGLAVAACCLGMATKEVMVTAPVVVLLFDRTFLSGSFGAAWRTRRRTYLALASSWLILIALVGGNAGRGGTAGFGSSVAWWAYAFTQIRAVVLYLRLCLWPHPLVFDYGLTLGGPRLEMICDAIVLAGLLAATAHLVRKGAPLGFLGAWFLLILAPSSSVVPVSTEIIAEHRAYLPLAAVMAALVCGGWTLAAAMGPRFGVRTRAGATAAVLIGLSAAAALGTATFLRNRVYLSVLSLWADVAAKTPESAGARNNYGNALAEQGRLDEAIGEFQAALRLVPDYDDPHLNLANVFTRQKRWSEAIEHYRSALRFRQDEARVHYALGSALAQAGRRREALAEYQSALAAKADSATVWYDLGNGLLDLDRADLAAEAFGRAVRIRPDFTDALVNYAGALAQTGRIPDAIRAFEDAVRLEPNSADVHNDLGTVLAQGGRVAEALAQFEEAVRLKPDYAEARRNLERARAIESRQARP